jgi:nicotinamidase/pyrazinamidase
MRDSVTGMDRPTELESMLREQGVARVVIGGLATDYCVRGTALDAMDRGFSVAVLTDAVAAVDRQSGDGARALDDLAAAGVELAATG